MEVMKPQAEALMIAATATKVIVQPGYSSLDVGYTYPLPTKMGTSATRARAAPSAASLRGPIATNRQAMSAATPAVNRLATTTSKRAIKISVNRKLRIGSL